MEAPISKFDAVTTDPLGFLEFLKKQDEPLYRRVADLIVFEEVINEIFGLLELYDPGVWDNETEVALDVLWSRYCGLCP